MTSRTRLRCQRLALLACSVLFCSLVLEVLLRVLMPVKTFVNPLSSFHQVDSELGWIGRPGVQARFRKVDFDVLVRHDERGFRAGASTVQSDSNNPVVAVLGDSFTWGWGVNNDEVVTDRLQALLGPGVDVRNLGLNSYGTVQELLLLKRLLKEGMRPSRVVVMLFENDYYDNISANGDRPAFQVSGTNVTLIHSPISRRVMTPGKDWLKKSHLISAIFYAADYAKEKRRIRNLQEQVFQAGQINDAARVAMSRALEQIRDLCRQSGSRLLCVYVTRYGEGNQPEPSAARSVTREICEQAGVTFLDLTPEFARLDAGELSRMYFPHDEHWTAKGHALAAAALARQLQQDMEKPGTASGPRQ